MQDKSIHLILKIRNLTTTEGLNNKTRNACSGGGCSFEKDAVSYEMEMTDVLIMGTMLQLGRLTRKLKGRPVPFHL